MQSPGRVCHLVPSAQPGDTGSPPAAGSCEAGEKEKMEKMRMEKMMMEMKKEKLLQPRSLARGYSPSAALPLAVVPVRLSVQPRGFKHSLGESAR